MKIYWDVDAKSVVEELQHIDGLIKEDISYIMETNGADLLLWASTMFMLRREGISNT